MELHIVSWNCERLAPYLTTAPQQLAIGEGSPPAAVTLADVFASFGAPHIVCLQEVRLRRQDAVLLRRAAEAVPGYTGYVHSCADDRNATAFGGRQYGVATFVHEQLPPAQVRTLPWDREGRVLITEFAELSLVVVNWYGVNGSDRPYYDHDMGDWHGDRHAFKLRSQEALLEALEAYRGWQLLVIGDVNVTPTAIDITPRLRRAAPHVAARTHLNDVFKQRLHLVDVWRHLHPDARQYTWFNRVAAVRGYLDAARVDYALVSESALRHVHAASIDDTPTARFRSDHAPIHLSLEPGGEPCPEHS